MNITLAFLTFINQLSFDQFNINDSISSTGQFLNDQSGILTLLSVVVAIIFFFVEQDKQRKDKQQEFNDRLRRICNTLLIDIDYLDDYYKGEIYKALKVKRHAADYSQNIINTSSYQSVINSGLITYFQKETQKELNSYYFYITMHNKRIFFMAEMANNTLNSRDLTR